jgi:hypothetical protein
MSTATQQLAPRSPAITSAPASENPKRLFAVTAVVVTPLAFFAALLLALPAGRGNAALIGVVPALFAAAFFGGLYWLAGALDRDGRVAVVEPGALEQNPGLPRGYRAA